LKNYSNELSYLLKQKTLLKRKKKNKITVAIIGAGPAGIAAAVQLKRAGIGFLLFEKNKPGGLLNNASYVENYPGFPSGIKGVDLVKKFLEQLVNLHIKVRTEKVRNLSLLKKEIRISTDKGEYYTSYLIIASGTKPKKFPADNGDIKIHYDITSLTKTHNKNIIIIGGGDAAFDYAVSLAERNNKIKILHRGNYPVCIASLLRKASKIKEIHYFGNTEVIDIKKSTSEALCFNKISQKHYSLKFDIVVAAIGRESELGFADKMIKKYIESENNNRIFLAGDVINGKYRQVSISTGDGIKCAMEIISRLTKKNDCKSKNR